MKTFIIGGTGLLGSASAAELIRRGHSVRSVALPPLPKNAVLPAKMEIIFGNYLTMSDEELLTQLTGCDSLVFAAGVDERIEFPKPVFEKYLQYNVAPVERLLRLGKQAGVKRAVIMGSYFSYFAKQWPKLKLSEHHPYIRAPLEPLGERSPWSCHPWCRMLRPSFPGSFPPKRSRPVCDRVGFRRCTEVPES